VVVRILVTGATGCVGHHVVRLLSKQGAMIRAAVHSPEKDDRLRLPGVEQIHVDCLDIESVRNAMSGIDRMFLLTPAAENMDDMTRNLVDEAKRAKVELIVKLSVQGADSKVPSDLGQRHRQAERQVELSGIAYVNIRPSGFMQNILIAHGRDIRERSEFYCSAGSGAVSMIDARDVAAAGVEALMNDKHANRAFNITGPKAITHVQMAEILSNIVGRKIAYLDVDEGSTREGLLNSGLSPWFAEAMVEHYRAVRSGERTTVTGDFEQLMGRGPSSFENFVKDCIERFMMEKRKMVIRTPAENL
jgi:uncharacterized protein YbjT (DUF2867 family)